MKEIGTLLRASGYAAKLGTKEWRAFGEQVRRERGNFCQMCKRGNIETQVHHWFYDPKREPWDYTAQEVVVLCAGCHKEIHAHLQNFRKYVFNKMTPAVLRVINGALAVALDAYDPLVFAHALAQFVSDKSLVQQYAATWERDAIKRTPEQEAFTKFKRSLKGRIDV